MTPLQSAHRSVTTIAPLCSGIEILATVMVGRASAAEVANLPTKPSEVRRVGWDLNLLWPRPSTGTHPSPSPIQLALQCFAQSCTAQCHVPQLLTNIAGFNPELLNSFELAFSLFHPKFKIRMSASGPGSCAQFFTFSSLPSAVGGRKLRL